MPFGLKNARATYQRLVNHMFRPKIGRNVEVYVDDMLVKSQDEKIHLDDLQKTFDTLRQYNMKLNPNKCAFEVSSGKFLGFMVSHKGIEANPDKIQAILDMKPPQNVKEVSHPPDELQPSIGLSLKPLTNVYHFSRFLKRHLNGRTTARELSKI